MTRAAFLGSGFMGQVHSRAARAAGAELVGVMSSSPERAAAAADALGIRRAFRSLDEILDDGSIDVVHVCTPNAQHAEQTLAILRAGKHVVCEKPLTTSLSDADELVAAVGSRVATVPFAYRFHPMVREARSRFLGGVTGEVVTVNASYLQDWLVGAADDNWRVDASRGGPSRAFADIGSHLVDLVEFITGDRVGRLVAVTKTVYPARGQHRDIDTEDTVAVVIELGSGAIGTLLVSQLAPGRKNRVLVEVSGTAETVAFNQEEPESLWIGRRAGSTVIPRDATQLAPDAARMCLVPAGHPQGYQDAFNAFVSDTYDAIAGASPEGLPDFSDGRRAVQVTGAVLESAATGAWVSVEEQR